MYPYPRNKSFTRVEVYNIENPEKPIKIKKIDFEGRLRESRITNGHLYFVTNKNIYNNYPIIPMVKIDEVEKTKIFGDSFYYVDAPLRNYNLTSITSLSLEDLSKISSKRILMPNVGNIYMSKNNFYLTYNKYFDTRILYSKLNEYVSNLMLERKRELDNENIKILNNGKIDYVFEEMEIDDIEISLGENFKPTIVSSSLRKFTQKEKDENRKYLLEKKKKIDEEFKDKIEKVIKDFYINNKDNFEKTKIEKFSLDGIKILAKASGEVSGFSLNQFSMHEDKNENFFVATTKNQN
ncbi:MAG TPA: hypothetical protein EYG72_02985 [Candidatus Pacebacteria bacterium]|nr:hypothetical protein [Candidatus Paceibacterota bacterium]